MNVREGCDIVYDVLVYGDPVEGRFFRVGWEDVTTVEDYDAILDIQNIATVDSSKTISREKGGWVTSLTGGGCVFFSIRAAMRAFDDEIVKRHGTQTRARSLHFPEDWKLERGEFPRRAVSGEKDGTFRPKHANIEDEELTHVVDVTKNRGLQLSDKSKMRST